MDSLTQFTLGAAVGEAVLGRKVGSKALWWGGVCGTLPDLDYLVSWGDAVKDFTYHRSASHSLFVLAVLTPVVVWLINRFHAMDRALRVRWLLMVYLVFVTHVLLDSFTVYGTQIFWPFVTTPMTWASIFIIDPLYTVPLLAGVVAALVLSRQRILGNRLNRAGLIISTVYLAWSFGAKLAVENHVTDLLAQKNVAYEKILVQPAPFNTLLWRILAMDTAGYYEIYYSLLDDHDDHLAIQHYPSQNQWLTGMQEHWPVKRLQWFTKGFYAVSRQDQDVIMIDLRMGVEPYYVFRFKVAEVQNGDVKPVRSRSIPAVRDFDRLSRLWERMWSIH